MSQHDYVLENQPGATFRADLNSALAAIVSKNSGATEPTITYPYQWWADTTSGKLKLRNAANSAWIEIGSLSNPNLGLALNGAITASGLTQSTGKLLGRTSSGTGAVEEISVGTGLALSGGSLTCTVSNSAFPSGTRMLFQQTTAPTGWTKDTTHNDKALRVVSGTAESGGSIPFSTVFGRTATDDFTLTTSHIPSHNHIQNASVNGGQATAYAGDGGLSNSLPPSSKGFPGTPLTTSYSGSGGAHSHGIDMRVQYVDLIIASKD